MLVIWAYGIKYKMDIKFYFFEESSRELEFMEWKIKFLLMDMYMFTTSNIDIKLLNLLIIFFGILSDLDCL